jgi:hypothetical protein
MRQVQSRRASGTRLVCSLVTILVIVLAAVPAVLAASGATEEILSIQRLNRDPDGRSIVTTRLTVPAQTRWVTDPDAGPLTFTVQTGALAVMLGGGSARIDRQSTPLMGQQIGPLQPGRTAVLRPSDRLIIVRGFDLTVTNDGDGQANAIVSRLVQDSAS